MPLFSHILIGCPASGKSTLARRLLEYDSSYCLVSTDHIREQLFGCRSIQRDWHLVQEEVDHQINLSLQSGHSIVYDATNVKREWRLELLNKFKPNYSALWYAWHIETPLEVCLFRNEERLYKVPDDALQSYYQTLQQSPPLKEEGFDQVFLIPYLTKSLDYNFLIERTLKELPQ